MADRRHWGLWIVGTGFLVSCGPPPQPKQMPPQAVSQQAPDPPPPSDPAPAAPVKTDTVIVVDKGEEDSKAPTLAEAGRAEKERRRTMDKPGVVINDKNLSQYAAKGQVTTAKAPESTAAKMPPPTPTATDGHDESYWRTRGLEIRQRWHDAADQVKIQQKSVEKLRTAFYAEDDPYVRDGRIKPEWDRALEKLDESRRGIEQAKKDLETFTDEGQRGGAYPAWLEEGIDLEPAQEVVKLKPNEPGEPKVIQPVSQEPPPHR